MATSTPHVFQFRLPFRTQRGQSLLLITNVKTWGEEGIVALEPTADGEWGVTLQATGLTSLHWSYRLLHADGTGEEEALAQRSFSLLPGMPRSIRFCDLWQSATDVGAAFRTAPFANVFRLVEPKAFPVRKGTTVLFRLQSPLLRAGETIAITGNHPALGNWGATSPLILQPTTEGYTAQAAMPLTQDLVYKYVIWDKEKGAVSHYEEGPDRQQAPATAKLTVINDGTVLFGRRFRGAGVAVPVFSLRSERSFGVGEFEDMKLLADWCTTTGLKLIQLLPINDTSASFTSQDSYPYAAISAFALHPIYLNLPKVAGKKWAAQIKSLAKKGKQLNALPELDYATVIKTKMAALREIFDLQDGHFLEDAAYKAFFAENRHWLRPYAAFCFFRDKWGTPDFSTWKTGSVYSETEMARLEKSSRSLAHLRFQYFLQFHLHQQLSEAVEYAHKRGIVIKGDLPIGIYRHSADAWVAPHLYHMEWQAGAPPDDFAVKGQNWGFPTYNWEAMQQDGYAWWRARFQQMSRYFDLFRIDHILGFFRIWSIPLHAVEGILGRFRPALPVHADEWTRRGVGVPTDRLTQPHIHDGILQSRFGEEWEAVRDTCMESLENGTYKFLPPFATQRDVETWIATHPAQAHWRGGLFDLISNVVLLEDEDAENAFHFRIGATSTSSFSELNGHDRGVLHDLYVDYFYRRQDGFWEGEGKRKLIPLKASTDMLVCGEDLGMVPECVPGVMRQLGLLSLEIQRMPKDPHTEFFHPHVAPYLSVVTPSTHDMSTVRGWWEEDRGRTQRFYNSQLQFEGEAPYFCEPWIARAILLQHLYSPAMWSVFQWQDLLAVSDELRRENPHEERINQPADPSHYWRYRMHMTLERLKEEKTFNAEFGDYLKNSGR